MSSYAGPKPGRRRKPRRICAWCGKILGEAQTREDTHGICTECALELLSERGITLLEPSLWPKGRVRSNHGPNP